MKSTFGAADPRRPHIWTILRKHKGQLMVQWPASKHPPRYYSGKKKYCIFEIRLSYIYNWHGGLPRLPLGYMNVHNFPLLFWKRVSQIISSLVVAISNINWPFLFVFFPKLNPSNSRGLIFAFISPHMISYPSSFFITSENALQKSRAQLSSEQFVELQQPIIVVGGLPLRSATRILQVVVSRGAQQHTHYFSHVTVHGIPPIRGSGQDPAFADISIRHVPTIMNVTNSRGQGFSPDATCISVSPGYSYRKQKDTTIQRTSQLYNSPRTNCIYPATWTFSDNTDTERKTTDI